MNRLYLLLLLLFTAPIAFTQNETLQEKDITVEWIQNRQKRVEESQLTEEEKKKLVEIYNQALDHIKLCFKK